MKKRIFYIDDDPDILEAVQIILEQHGFAVHTTNDIRSIEEVIRFNPDIILLDLLLRGKSGREVAQQIKKIHALRKIPIIIFSAHTLSKIEQVTKTYEATDYLQKPFDIDSLLQTINKYIS